MKMKKEELKLSLFADDVIVYKKKKKGKEATKKTSRTNKWVHKIMGEHTKIICISRY